MKWFLILCMWRNFDGKFTGSPIGSFKSEQACEDKMDKIKNRYTSTLMKIGYACVEMK